MNIIRQIILPHVQLLNLSVFNKSTTQSHICYPRTQATFTITAPFNSKNAPTTFLKCSNIQSTSSLPSTHSNYWPLLAKTTPPYFSSLSPSLLKPYSSSIPQEAQEEEREWAESILLSYSLQNDE